MVYETRWDEKAGSPDGMRGKLPSLTGQRLQALGTGGAALPAYSGTIGSDESA